MKNNYHSAGVVDDDEIDFNKLEDDTYEYDNLEAFPAKIIII